MPRFAIVVAADEAGGIGKGGKLPWRLKGDMAYFKLLTQEPPSPETANAVIMGRVTWDSIPETFRPLRGRINLVITDNPRLRLPDDVVRARSLDEALIALDGIADIGRVFVIGGGQIYRHAVRHRDLEAIHLTRVHATFDCDTFFPEIPPGMTLAAQSPPQTEGALTYAFSTWRKC
jgi:dihydrofolate reductase